MGPIDRGSSTTAWYYQQIRQLGRGAPPDPDLDVLHAFLAEAKMMPRSPMVPVWVLKQGGGSRGPSSDAGADVSITILTTFLNRVLVRIEFMICRNRTLLEV
jgi:hypothetical protein